VTSAAPPLPPAVAGEVHFGLADSSRDDQSKLACTLHDLVQRIADSLQKAASNLASAEVMTYSSDDLAGVKYENERFSGAKLCALTRLDINGNTLVCVPASPGGKVDDALWKIHCDAVDKALANRTEIVKLASAAADLLAALKPL
jgi:hypothetical protein